MDTWFLLHIGRAHDMLILCVKKSKFTFLLYTMLILLETLQYGSSMSCYWRYSHYSIFKWFVMFLAEFQGNVLCMVQDITDCLVWARENDKKYNFDKVNDLKHKSWLANMNYIISKSFFIIACLQKHPVCVIIVGKSMFKSIFTFILYNLPSY